MCSGSASVGQLPRRKNKFLTHQVGKDAQGSIYGLVAALISRILLVAIWLLLSHHISLFWNSEYVDDNG